VETHIFSDSRLTDVSEASLARRPAALYLQEGPWYSFLLEAESTPGAIVRLEGSKAKNVLNYPFVVYQYYDFLKSESLPIGSVGSMTWSGVLSRMHELPTQMR
jgi:hypothetical protein